MHVVRGRLCVCVYAYGLVSVLQQKDTCRHCVFGGVFDDFPAQEESKVSMLAVRT